MANFLWGQNGQKMTPQQVERERLASALMARDAGQTTPVASPFAGLNRALQGYISGKRDRAATEAENAGLAGADAAIAGLGGAPGYAGGTVYPSSMGGQASGNPMFPTGQDSVAPPNEMTPGGYAMGAVQDPSLDLIRGFEGFRETPYWDVNALRTGYGSDTVTLADGSVVPVTAGTRVTREDADRDLQRRVNTEFMPIAARAVGEDVFASLAPNQQAALTSIAYNYGKLPSSVAAAVRSGDPNAAAAAIAALGSHNDGINAGRRSKEAEYYLGGGNVTMSASGAPSGGTDLASLLALQADPWVTQKYGGVVDALMGQAIQQRDPLYQAQLAEATRGPGPSEYDLRAQAAMQYGIDPQSPEFQRFVLGGELGTPDAGGFTLGAGETRFDANGNPIAEGAAKAGYRPMTPQEVAATPGLDPGKAWQVSPDGKIEQIGGGGVTVNNSIDGGPADVKLRGKLMEKEGELWSSYLQTGATSAGTVQDMAALDELIGIAPQGPVTGRLAEMFPGFSSAGDAFQSIVKRVAPTLRAPGSGSTSDIEYDGMLRSLPALRNSPEANRAIAGMMKAKAAINVERSNIVSAYQNGEIDAVEARRQMAELDKRSIMTPELAVLFGGGEPPESAPSPATGGKPRKRYNPATGGFE